jgi:hypothetical protein
MAVGAEKSFCLLVFHEAKFLATLRRQLLQNEKSLLSKQFVLGTCVLLNNGCVCVCVCVCVFSSQIHRQREATRLLFNILGTRQACKYNVTLKGVRAAIVAAES